MSDPDGAIHRETDRNGTVVTLRLTGAFDRGAHRELGRLLRQALRRLRPLRVVVDVGQVRAVDGRCVDVLLLGYTWALRGGHGYEVVDARGAVRPVLEAAGLCARLDDDEVLYPPVWLDAERFLPNSR